MNVTNEIPSDFVKCQEPFLSHKTHKRKNIKRKAKQKIKYKFVTPFLCFQIAFGNAFKGLNEENGKQKKNEKYLSFMFALSYNFFWYGAISIKTIHTKTKEEQED